MNVELKSLVRLLFAILLVSLISTIFLGKHIHKQILETVKENHIKQKFILSHETKIPTKIPSKIPTQIPSKILSKTASKMPLNIPKNIPPQITKVNPNVNSTKEYRKTELTTKKPVPLVTINPKIFEEMKIKNSEMFRLPEQEAACRDWHSERIIIRDLHRKGLGEQGRAAPIRDPAALAAGKTLLGLHGYQALLSDKISVNRSQLYVCSKRCRKVKYLAKLPNATVVISFHNEHLSVLLRSLHSIVNRSPAKLLREIILVDDASNLEDLGQKLTDYVANNFKGIVSLVRLSERSGLIKARMEGAKRASCQVLIFLDSHIEATHNWLPPLLQPIAIHRTIVTGPILDAISAETFGYETGAMLTRSAFNWHLHVKHLPTLFMLSSTETLPYRTPLLVGAMAIDRSYFWELGGYDEELDIWGGEHFEMSFKIWMCGGMLLYVPCSRVGHISRGPVVDRSHPRNYNFLARNYKRVAEVWMDDYKKIVYERNPELFRNVDAGNLTAMKAQREQLKCKSFDWYMTNVAPDVLAKFPTVEPPPLASGVIQSVAYPNLCMDTLNREFNQPLGLASCSNPPGMYQDWALTQDHEIRLRTGTACLEQAGKTNKNTDVILYHCHNLGGNQFWYYNRKWKWIQQGDGWHRCLEAIRPSGDNQGRVVSNLCNKKNLQQQWYFGEATRLIK